MNRDETLALFARGYRHWNAWADAMLAEKEQLIEAGHWEEGYHIKSRQPMRSWEERATADFSGHRFGDDTDFFGFRFAGPANFEGAIFSGHARFHAADFVGIARFSYAEFDRGSNFDGVEFPESAEFSRTTFRGSAAFAGTKFQKGAHFDHAVFEEDFQFNQGLCKGILSLQGATVSGRAVLLKTEVDCRAEFQQATFSGQLFVHRTVFLDNASFDHSNFEGPAYISESSFNKEARMLGVRGKGLVLSKVEFGEPPVFSAAHFDEPPLFDRVDLAPERFVSGQGDGEEVAFPERWRALRRLAAHAHDHERELLFFKGEIVSRRGTEDTWKHFRFWAGWIYQVLSDFGLSMTRPLIWLFATLVLFAGFYLHTSSTALAKPGVVAPCPPDSRETLVAALSLSIHSAVPFAGMGSSGKAEEIYACLYGLRARGLPTHGIAPQPIIPAYVSFAGVGQFIVSTVLIFLLVLAIRNQFRIR